MTRKSDANNGARWQDAALRRDEDEKTTDVATLEAQEERLEKVRHAVRKDKAPELGPLTAEDVEELRKDPVLAELAEVAEQYV